MRVQAVLDFVEAFLDRFPDRFGFGNGYSLSSLAITESKSSIFKEGCEVRFDIFHSSVVLVDKSSPFLVRQRHLDSRANSVPLEWRRPQGPCLYL